MLGFLRCEDPRPVCDSALIWNSFLLLPPVLHSVSYPVRTETSLGVYPLITLRPTRVLLSLRVLDSYPPHLGTGRPQHASNGARWARALWVLQLPPRGARRELRPDFGRVDAKTANQDSELGGGVVR